MSAAFSIMNIATQNKDSAVQRLTTATSLLRGLAAGDWPYDDSKDALAAIISLFEQRAESLRSLEEASDEIVNSWCYDTRALVARYHSFTGAILRSSNVRNAFEAYYPIRKLATELLGADYKIILSSEWSYTPFVYPIPISGLDRYIFIGQPASEAENALLVPLSGHEIGHALWRKPSFADDIRLKIRDEIIKVYLNIPSTQNDLFPASTTAGDMVKDFRLQSIWKKSYEVALRQCEELFCDLLACWVFGESFLHAFRYMLAPELVARSGEYYPTHRARAQYLTRACSRFHGSEFDLSKFFETDKSAPLSRQEIPDHLRRADEASGVVVDTIIDEIERLCTSLHLTKPSVERTEEALNSIQTGKPFVATDNAADVINAAWQLRLGMAQWKLPGVDERRNLQILNDLVFKSFEVAEWHERQAQT